jgi:hypothetical protein
MHRNGKAWIEEGASGACPVWAEWSSDLFIMFRTWLHVVCEVVYFTPFHTSW